MIVAPNIPQDAFAALGVGFIAYIRRNGQGWAIHAANGDVLGTGYDRDHLTGLCLQHDLMPQALH